MLPNLMEFTRDPVLNEPEPSLSTTLQEKQGVQGTYALVRGGSSTSNLL